MHILILLLKNYSNHFINKNIFNENEEVDLFNTILGFKKDEAQNFGDIDNGPKEEKKPKIKKPSKQIRPFKLNLI